MTRKSIGPLGQTSFDLVGTQLLKIEEKVQEH